MGEREKTVLGFLILAGLVLLIAGSADKEPGVAALGIWVLIGSVVYCGWRDGREKRRRAAIEARQRVVARPEPPPFRTRAEMDALVQLWLDGRLLPETPKRTVIRTTIYVRRTETDE